MRTSHQYLDKYPISKDSKKLIVGTIHPHEHESFLIPFFYGSVSSLWNIFSDAFPQELQKPITLEAVLQFLKNKKISLCDTIRICERKKPTPFDSDLIPIELNRGMIDQIRNSEITEIFFTSGFGKNGAFKLFYQDILGLKITRDMRKQRESILDETIFGRQVKLTSLLSPSGASNIGLSKTKQYLENKAKYANSPRPVYDFKVDYYREKFK
ncbi:MAG: hypothetical protein ACI7YS_00530 [Flavobacterium sp.]